MYSELWFVTDGVRILSVFRTRDEAVRELGRFEDEPDYQFYDCYSVEIENLVDYPDEYELALDMDLIS